MLGAAGVNLAIEQGEICVLMGLSGSGKSTILRAVNGLNKVARGTVLVAHGDGDDRRRQLHAPTSCACCAPSRIAMVFQQFALLPWRTVAENVGFGLELRGAPKARDRPRSSTRSSPWSA